MLQQKKSVFIWPSSRWAMLPLQMPREPHPIGALLGLTALLAGRLETSWTKPSWHPEFQLCCPFRPTLKSLATASLYSWSSCRWSRLLAIGTRSPVAGSCRPSLVRVLGCRQSPPSLSTSTSTARV